MLLVCFVCVDFNALVPPPAPRPRPPQWLQDRKVIERAAIDRLTDSMLHELADELLPSVCSEAKDRRYAAGAAKVLSALSKEVVHEMLTDVAAQLLKDIRERAVARHLVDAAMFEVSREFAELAMQDAMRDARKRAVAAVAGDVVDEAFSDLLLHVAEQQWQDAQPKNSFQLLTIDPHRIRKKVL